MWAHRKKQNIWKCTNVITNFDQKIGIEKNTKIIFQWEVIGYKKDGVENLVVPSFEIINNFPVYKMRSKKYKTIKKYLKKRIWNNSRDYRVVTHTRFFLTTFIGWVFAKKNNIQWAHIEHGSDHVELSSYLNTKIAYCYDRIIGKSIFKKADTILAISNACKNFIQWKFIKKNVQVFYRGIDIKTPEIKKQGEVKFVFVWRLVKLKWVNLLIEAYKKSELKNKLIVIWDGEEKSSLKKISEWSNIEFLGQKDKAFVVDFLSKNNCILINPSYQEWLPTTVIEWLLTWNIVIASDVWGTKEISNQEDLILFESWNKEELARKILLTQKKYKKLQGKSKEDVRKKFNWRNNILNVYNFIQ